MPVRQATVDDLVPVMRLLDAAVLDTDIDVVRTRIGEADVLLHDGDGPPAGVIVLDGGTVIALAVKRARRDEGIGRRLVTAARNRRGPLTAEFDRRVRPFYESLGFDVRPLDDAADRYRGILD